MNRKVLKKEIISFYKDTILLQFLFVVVLVVMLGINLNFNDKIRLWSLEKFLIIYQVFTTFELEDVENFATIYFYVILFLNIIIVNSIFISIPIIKYYFRKRRSDVSENAAVEIS